MPKKKENLSLEERLQKVIIPKEEEPYIIPDNWIWTRLGDITNILNGDRGKNYPAKNKLSKTGKFPFISASNLENGEILTENLSFLTDEQYEKLRAGKLKENDLLFCIRGSLGKFGKNYFSQGAIASSLVIVRSVLKTQEIIEYLEKYFKTILIKNEILKYNNGTAQPNLSAENFRRFFLPLPPLEEQKRIVEKLDSLFEKTQKIKEIIEEVKEKTILRREAFLSKAFTGELTEKWRKENKNLIPVNIILGRIENEKKELLKKKIIKKTPKIEPVSEKDILFEIPKSWERIKLNDIAFVTKLAGFEYTKSIYPNLVKEGVPLFKGKNVQAGKIIYDFESYIPENISDELSRSQITKKCLLTPYVGTIGNIALFNGKFKAHLGSNVGKIEVFNNFNENILEEYLLYYFRSCYGLAQLRKHKKATAQESISIEAIRDCVIIIPPLEEQKEIVRILDKVFEEEDKISELLLLEEKVEALEKTILDKAFRGELGTGNIEDEPAIELLKKIL